VCELKDSMKSPFNAPQYKVFLHLTFYVNLTKVNLGVKFLPYTILSLVIRSFLIKKKSYIGFPLQLNYMHLEFDLDLFRLHESLYML
jgi:hypothetical protein